jgi:hypothetical protein
MTNFIPDQPKQARAVPFYDDVNSESGWQGQSTTKTIETLKSEITSAISRLGGVVTGFQKGTFEVGSLKREGYRVSYNIETPDGGMVPGRIDIAALPVKAGGSYRANSSYQNRCEKSLKMSLYMLKISFDGLWFLQQLSPGFAPLMPFMLAKNDQTISQLWCESATMKNLLPPGGSDFVDGEFAEAKHG